MTSMTNSYKVKLTPKIRTDEFDRPVVFEVTPDITENRVVNYKTMEPVHMPGAIHVYNNTSSRSYSVTNIKLISRSPEEATLNLARLNLLRSWTMPRFGRDSSTLVYSKAATGLLQEYKQYTQERYPYEGEEKKSENEGRVLKQRSVELVGYEELMGAPPPIVFLTAYANSTQRGNIYKIPTVITNLTIPYPSEVDYISTLGGQPFPTIMTIDIQMTEVHSAREYEQFSLNKYRAGDLSGF